MSTLQINDSIQFLWTYLTVQQFIKKHPAFTMGGLRSLIFNEHQNRLAESGAICRIGRKVLICEEKFFAWIETLQRTQSKSPSKTN